MLKNPTSSLLPNTAQLKGWQSFFKEELEKDYFIELWEKVSHEYESQNIYPPKSLIFNSFYQTPLDTVKVVIMGQDPYHGPGQAHGLSFSVNQGVAIPPSLKNIYKELAADLNIKPPQHGCLLSWAHQGVLLLNATLTVKESAPKSHYGLGWETFTDHIVEFLGKQDRPLVFMLWGKSAQEKCLHALKDLDCSQHLILKTTHPSPFSAYSGFLGSRHFSKANNFLKNNALKPINWEVS